MPCSNSLLARAGVSMDIQDKDGWTPLHAASRWAQPEAIEALIDNGADIHIVNTFVRDMELSYLVQTKAFLYSK